MQQGKIYEGMKLHFLLQQVVDAGESSSESKIYFFQRNLKLALNFNGMTPARSQSKLGLQTTLLVPKSLQQVISKAGAVAFVQVVLLKKYPIFFSEYSEKVQRRFFRCRQTAESLSEKEPSLQLRPCFKLRVRCMQSDRQAFVSFVGIAPIDTYNEMQPGD